MSADQVIKEAVKVSYGSVARSGRDTEVSKKIATTFGYSEEELKAIPEESNMGLSCGNPTAIASLKEGEVVLDLGCGAGFDVFLAAQKVGTTGKVIGIDMTQDMINKAESIKVKRGIANVEFRLGEIESLPVEDSSIDCIISNCVINLVPNKLKAFQEMFRVLKKSGRVAISDVALKKPLPAKLQDDMATLVECIGGAIQIDDYRNGLVKAGFKHVDIIDSHKNLNSFKESGCCGSSSASCGSSTQQVVSQSCCSSNESCCAPTQSDEEITCCDDGVCTVKSSVPSKLVMLTPETSSSCCGGSSKKEMKSSCCGEEPSVKQVDWRDYDLNEFAASVKVYAIKE